jgi:hypothetical protein
MVYKGYRCVLDTGTPVPEFVFRGLYPPITV